MGFRAPGWLMKTGTTMRRGSAPSPARTGVDGWRWFHLFMGAPPPRPGSFNTASGRNSRIIRRLRVAFLGAGERGGVRRLRLAPRRHPAKMPEFGGLTGFNLFDAVGVPGAPPLLLCP
ncbi:hypothetical protein DAI22_11g150825 [Oryza sativa Japonica Group]|nr:hypothetical protein DAI22_11g150825 [Oryza sativa Japonica Group]